MIWWGRQDSSLSPLVANEARCPRSIDEGCLIEQGTVWCHLFAAAGSCGVWVVFQLFESAEIRDGIKAYAPSKGSVPLRI